MGKNKRATVGDNYTIDVGKVMHIKAGEKMVLEVGKSKITMQSDGAIKLEGTDISNQCDCEFSIKAKNNVTIKGKKVTEN